MLALTVTEDESSASVIYIDNWNAIEEVMVYPAVMVYLEVPVMSIVSSLHCAPTDLTRIIEVPCGP